VTLADPPLAIEEAQFHERRFRRRFPLSFPLEYAGKSERDSTFGLGRTLDVSSSGVRFLAERPLAAGMQLSIAIDWPRALADGVPLRLVLSVEVVRAGGREAAAKIYQYEFRTRRPR